MPKRLITIGLHTMLILAGLIGIMLNMIYGLYPFSFWVEATFTTSSVIVVKRVITIFYLLIITIGIALREYAWGTREFLKTWAIAAIVIFGAVAATGGFIMSAEGANSTSYSGMNYYYTLDTMAGEILQWYYVTKIVFLAIPMGVIIIGIVLIFRSEGVDDYMTAFIEIFSGIGIIVVSNIMLNWSGIDLFDFDPSLVQIPEEMLSVFINSPVLMEFQAPLMKIAPPLMIVC